MSENRDVFLAKLAEEAERYDDMVTYVTRFAKELGPKMDVEQRNLLSVAYKNVVGAKRASWRVLSSMELGKASENNAALVSEYKEKVEKELVDTCHELLQLLDTYVLEKMSDSESDKDSKEAIVFFRKMAGDYYRYIAEIKKGDQRTEAANQAEKHYSAARKIELAPTSPIRLGLALNFS
ncbi:TFT2, partial [Symbiodinium sp. KB8]